MKERSVIRKAIYYAACSIILAFYMRLLFLERNFGLVLYEKRITLDYMKSWEFKIAAKMSLKRFLGVVVLESNGRREETIG